MRNHRGGEGIQVGGCIGVKGVAKVFVFMLPVTGEVKCPQIVLVSIGEDGAVAGHLSLILLLLTLVLLLGGGIGGDGGQGGVSGGGTGTATCQADGY